MIWSFPIASLILTVALMVELAWGAELKGKVVEVLGQDVKIQLESEGTPNVGDRVEISFHHPAIGKISIGNWRVTKVDSKFVFAKVVEATGKPDLAQDALIFSESQKSVQTNVARLPKSENRKKTMGRIGSAPEGEGIHRQGKITSKRKVQKQSGPIGGHDLGKSESKEGPKPFQNEKRLLELKRKELEVERLRLENERKKLAMMQKRLRKQREKIDKDNSSKNKSSTKMANIPRGPHALKQLKGKDGALMLFVPAGEFIRGDTSKEGEEDERPVRKIYLDAFYIDKFPVTNRLYKKIMGAQEIAGGDDLPIKDIDWEDAKSYCEKVDKRLPTEAEWEKAARGTDGRKYPWGNDWDESKLIWMFNSMGTQPVNRSYKTHKSPYGVVDMVGNVSEWVSDWYQADYYKDAPARNPKGPEPQRSNLLQGHVVRGSSYLSGEQKSHRISSRGWVIPFAPKFHVGFRCAKDAG